MIKNVMYLKNIAKIGGVEDFVYQLAKNYQEYDLVVFYNSGDNEQIKRLRKYCKTVQWDGHSRVECERFFTNYAIDMVDYVDAKEYYQVIHANYEIQNITPHLHEKFNKYIAVSDLVRDTYLRVSKLPADKVVVCHNPLEIDTQERVPTLFIGSFTRLTYEKGAKRIVELSNKLDKVKDFNYLWLIYTDNYEDNIGLTSKNVILIEPKLNGITNLMSKVDIVAQLSDTEGLCYAVNQAKTIGTTVLYTPCPSFAELGVNEKDDIKLEFDMSNIDDVVDKIVKLYNKGKIKKSSFKLDDDWSKWLVKGGVKSKNELICVRALDTYKKLGGITDAELGYAPEENEIFYITKERLDTLLGNNAFKKAFVEIVKEETNE